MVTFYLSRHTHTHTQAFQSSSLDDFAFCFVIVRVLAKIRCRYFSKKINDSDVSVLVSHHLKTMYK